MYQFNPDGSIKVPEAFEKQTKEKEHRLKTQRCILVRKEVVSDKSPKKCLLRITLSDAFTDSGFVKKTYGYFMGNSEVPSKLTKVNDKEFEVEIGTCFRRCSDCNSLIRQFKDFLDGNVIEEQGSCTYEGKSQHFCYEDHFL